MLYRTYLFIDKDPEIDRMRTAMQEAGASVARISQDSGLAYATIRGWFEGETQRPQHASVMAFYRALGLTMQPVRADIHRATDKTMVDMEKRAAESRKRRRARIARLANKRRAA